ncbi:GreA/GreB family elongation factor [Aquimarina intermedia]|uniref:Regulator of nucleoside diphosphate kinase n=1 Tax=Aquimarina intermedia TaxID=350814 RepID=A0A5S5C5T4_9FLAO|nr:GreA/GreB family elongation factor [Aquimarina intermedia]TYP73680.1 regulator of nucleoside diphosphate kinase [Aquimarina intermedia]
MKYGSLIIEKKEYVYLKRILNISEYVEDFQTQKSLIRLGEELKNALIVDEDDIPKDIVRFTSHVTVRSEIGWEKTIQIVIPAEKDAKNDKISVLRPMGAALFGYAEGDSMTWDFLTGKQQLKIVSVIQMEDQKINVTT